MNALSWMIYLADITGSISGFLSVVAGVTGLAAAVLFIWCGILSSDAPTIWSWDDKDAKLAAHKATTAATKKYGFIALKVCLPAALIACFIPSQGTIYAIAASQTSEKVLTSATGTKAVAALNAWLDRQIAAKPEVDRK